MNLCPTSDLQSRLGYIKDEADKIKETTPTADIERLAELVSYLSAIVRKHLRENER